MPLRLPDEVHSLLDRLTGHGFAAYVVGGCVRDALMGLPPHDWDICTAARPEEIEACFAGARIIKTGDRFGTLTVLLGGTPYEITTFRREGAYADHRHPGSIAFTTDITEDLCRRDFTINAMAYHPAAGLIDPFHGGDDLARGVIRCVGKPDERFNEDALRILRALRFASTLGFAVSDATASGMLENAHLLSAIAPERISAELSKLLPGAHAEAALLHFPEILCVPIPEIRPCIDFEQHSPYHHLTVWAHTCLAVGSAPSDLVVRLALLLHDIAKPACLSIGADGRGHFYGHPEQSATMAKTILRRLRYDAATIDRVTVLIKYHDAALTPTEPAARRWLNRLGEETLLQLLAVKRADAAAHANPASGYAYLQAFDHALARVLAAHDCFSIKDLAIDGADILRIPVPEGPMVGMLLTKLLDEVMEEKIQNERASLLSRARELAGVNA